MKQTPIKLGVLALLLLVISICLSTLGVLTFSTAQADLRLAQRYAETTRQQYVREAAGQTFLWDADLALKSGKALTELEGVTESGGLYSKNIREGNVTLHIELRLIGQDGFEIVRWETGTEWAPEENTEGLWGG